MKKSFLFLSILLFLFSLCQCKEVVPHYSVSFNNGLLMVYSSSSKSENLSYEIKPYSRIDTILRGNAIFHIYEEISDNSPWNKLPDQLDIHLKIGNHLDTLIAITIPHISEKNGRLYFKNLNKCNNITVDYRTYGKEEYKVANNDTIIDCVHYLRNLLNNRYEIALEATQNNGINVIATINNATSNTFKIQLERPIKKATLYANEISNFCNPFIKKSLQFSEDDIRKYLFRKKIHFDDTFVRKMGVNYALLEKSDFSEIVTRDTIVPVYGNPKELKFKIESNLKADYYYLLLSNIDFSSLGRLRVISALDHNSFDDSLSVVESNVESLNLDSFIEEQVSSKFLGGITSLDQEIPLTLNKRNNGSLLMLIGLNKDWTYKYVPIGLLGINDSGPSLFEMRNPDDNRSLIDRYVAMSKSGFDDNNNSFFANRESSVKSKRDRRTTIVNGRIIEIEHTQSQIYFEDLNITAYPHKKLSLSRSYSSKGSVGWTVNDFYGNSPSIRLSWSDEVVSIQFGDNHIFDLTKYQSPHTFSFYHYTNLGKNELLIKATNKYGNSSSSIISFEMRRIDNNPTINIENNIYDSPNSTVNTEVNIY